MEFIPTVTNELLVKKFIRNFCLPACIQAIMQEKICVRMGRVIAGWNPFIMSSSQSAAFELSEPFDDSRKLFSIFMIDNHPSVAVQQSSWEHVDPAPEHDFRRLKMEIETRTLHSRPCSLPEKNTQVGFVGGHVQAETSISAYSKQRLIDLRRSDDARRYRSQSHSHSYHKSPSRPHHMILILLSMAFKPNPIVVPLQIREELDRLSGKASEI